MPADLHLEHFLAALKKEGNHSRSTLGAYHWDLKQFGLWLQKFHPELTDLKQLTPLISQEYIHHIFRKKELSRSTVGRRYQAMRRLCQWALATGKCTTDFCELVTSPVVERRHIAPKPLTNSQIQALLRSSGSSAHGFGSRNYALVQLMLETGLSVGEVVHLKNQEIFVSDRTGFVRVKTGHRHRKIMLPNKSRWALRRYWGDQGDCPPGRATFLNQEAAALTVRGVQHILADVTHRAGLTGEGVTAQRLRYTFGANYLKRHPDQRKELGTILGLRSPVSLRIYASDGTDRRKTGPIVE